jgi:hypothetical protein
VGIDHLALTITTMPRTAIRLQLHCGHQQQTLMILGIILLVYLSANSRTMR